jgi:hypothetical protein
LPFILSGNLDSFVKSPNLFFFVIPANPGSDPGQAPESSKFNWLSWSWTPVSTGVTTFYEAVNIGLFPFRRLFLHLISSAPATSL